MTLQEYFERLTTDEKWGKPLAALLGAFQAQLDFGVPAIGGKDSMSGSFGNLHVPPTLVAFAVGITEAGRVRSAAIPAGQMSIYRLPLQRDEHGLPKPDLFLKTLAVLQRTEVAGQCRAGAVVQGSGAAVAAIRMCLGEQLGLTFSDTLSERDLFSPDHGTLLVALPDTKDHPAAAAAVALIQEAGASLLGVTTTDGLLCYREARLPLESALKAYESTLEPIFPTQVSSNEPPAVLPLQPAAMVPSNDSSAALAGKATRQPKSSGKARPRVVIPVFPGTNCEYDTARAFEMAGAEPDILIVRNLDSEAIAETLHELEHRIRKAQIVMLPGGFSGTSRKVPGNSSPRHSAIHASRTPFVTCFSIGTD